SMRRIVARLIISAHLPRGRIVVRWRIDSAPLRLMWLFASLAAPPLRRIVTSRSVIGSPFTARRRFIARRIIAFIAAFGHTFRRGAIYVFRLPWLPGTRRRSDALGPSVIGRTRRPFGPSVWSARGIRRVRIGASFDRRRRHLAFLRPAFTDRA